VTDNIETQNQLLQELDYLQRKVAQLEQQCEQAEKEKQRLAERLEVEQNLLKAVVQQMPAGVGVAEAPSGKLIFGSEQMSRIWRQPFRVLESVDEYFEYKGFEPETNRPYQNEEWPLARSITSGEVVSAEEIKILRGDSSYGIIQVSSTPIYDNNGHIMAGVVVFYDITERKKADEGLKFLAEASNLLASSLDYATTLKNIARLAVPRLADWCTIDMASEYEDPSRPTSGRPHSLRHLVVTHTDPAKEKLVNELRERLTPEMDETNPMVQAFMSGQPQLIPEIPDELIDVVTDDPAVRQLLRELKLKSALYVPLIARGRKLGLLALNTSDSGRILGPEDVQLAEELGRRAAVAIDNARLYTEVQQAIQRQQESAALLNTLLATAPVGFGFWDQDLRYVHINSYLANMNGLPVEAHLGRTIQEAVPHLAPAVAPYFKQVLETGQPLLDLEVSGPVRSDPSQTRHALASYYPVNTPDGRMLGVGVVVLDISERKQAEAERAALLAGEQAARRDAEAARRGLAFLSEAGMALNNSLDYEATLQAIANLVVPELADWCTVYIMEKGAHQSEASAHPVAVSHIEPDKAKLVRKLCPPVPEKPGKPGSVTRAILAGKSQLISTVTEATMLAWAEDEDTLKILRELAPVSSMVVPMYIGPRPVGALALVGVRPGQHFSPADLQLAEELARRAAVAIENAQLYREIRRAVQLRDEFLSIAAHELKTPITSLKGYSQLLNRQLSRTGELNLARLQQTLQVIERQSDKLTQLITQLLDVSRLETGKMLLNFRPTDLSTLVQEVAELSRSTLTNSHTILVDTPPQVVVRVDPLRLEQSLFNLVSNAIKFSPEGTQLKIEVKAPEKAQTVQLAVTDQGIGIPVEHRARLFERFHQAHPGNYGSGLGLGLYITRQIIGLHGGTVRAEFPEEGGTRFLIELPA
jgi:PAS domain S-box-containing protein